MIDFWERNQNALRAHKRNEPLEYFLRWSTVQATMWHGDSYLTRKELDVLQGNDWQRWQRVLVPEGFGAYESQFYSTSGNLINQAYHLHVLESETGIRVEELDAILEVGSGYGALARLIFALGFQGKYYSCDLPEMLELQSYYLTSFVPPGSFIPVSDLTHNLPEVDLLIGLYSLCEMSLPKRARILNRIRPRVGYLLSYQETYGEIDNRKEFFGLQKKYPEYVWKTIPVPEMVVNWCLVGKNTSISKGTNG